MEVKPIGGIAIIGQNVFVARRRELAQLNAYLECALGGQSAVCFVSGDAGRGKTTLMTEFACLAQERHAELVVAVGLCDPQTGAGAPYLPFREILEMLLGDVDSGLAQGTITQENADRLRSLRKISGQLIEDIGTTLISALIPGSSLIATVGIWLAKKSGLTAKLKGTTDAQPPPEAQTIKFEDIDQGRLFEQYVNVLKSLAQHSPLLLVLDDIQWADVSSLELLFHLTRRLESAPVMMVGAYRPADVAQGRAGERHPLEKVLAEIKRYRGRVEIDLEQDDPNETLAFVNAMLDTEPNRFGPDFRRALYEHTGGHPLFIVELLHDMQERGDVAPNEAGEWTPAARLNWDQLPARVEGVVEERVGRLSPGLRETLRWASVQGDVFIAEVLARVQNVETRQLLGQLDAELEKRHRLVKAQGQQRMGDQRLSRYQFQNRLVQTYLYAGLNPTELPYRHEDVGRALEALYGEQADDIAIQLAWHFEKGRLDDKARYYLRRAGEQAAAQAASDDALDYLSRALALTPQDGRPERMAERYGLLLTREDVYHLLGNRQAQAGDLAELEALAGRLAAAASLSDDQSRPQAQPVQARQAEVALRQARYAAATSDYPAAIAAARSAINWAQTGGDAAQAAAGQTEWGRALFRQGEYAVAQTHLEKGVSLAQSAGRPDLEAKALLGLGAATWRRGNFDQAQGHYKQALSLGREIGDRLVEAWALNSLGVIAYEQGDYTTGKDFCQQTLAISRQIGDQQNVGTALNNLGEIARWLGDYAGAQGYYEQLLVISREIDDRMIECAAIVNLGLVASHLGDNEKALAHSQKGLQIARTIGSRRWEAMALRNLGHALAQAGRWNEATATYREAVDVFQAIGDAHVVMEPLAGLAWVALAQGEPAQAQRHIEAILASLNKGSDALDSHSYSSQALDGTDEPMRVYLVCYQALQANADPRARTILTVACTTLQGQAARISDVKTRRAFLDNVPFHRELISAFADQVAGTSAAEVLAAWSPLPETPTPLESPGETSSPALPQAASRTIPQAALEALAPKAAPDVTVPRAAPSAAPATAVPGLASTQPVPPSRAARPRPPGRSGRLPLQTKARAPTQADAQPKNVLGIPIPQVQLDLSRLRALLLWGLLASLVITGSIGLGYWLGQRGTGSPPTPEPVYSDAFVIQADLRWATLAGADLRGALLIGANLETADLRGADLRGANLLSANLRGADLRGADLRSSLLQANPNSLLQSDYTHPALRAMSPELWAKLNLGDADLTGAVYNAETLWPAGFVPPPAAIQEGP